MRKYYTAESLFLKRAASKFYGGAEVHWLSGGSVALQELCDILKNVASEPRASLQLKLDMESGERNSCHWLIIKLQQAESWHITEDSELDAFVFWMNNDKLRQLCDTIQEAIADEDYCGAYSITPYGAYFNPKKGVVDVLDITCVTSRRP